MARPAKAPLIQEETLARIDAWRAEHPEQPGRLEAIQRLLDIGLRSPPRPPATTTTTIPPAPARRGTLKAKLV